MAMNDEEAIARQVAGWNVLMNHAAIIAELPLELWLEQFSKAESIAPILDPTLYRDYIHSRKGDLIQSIIRAALPLKKAVLDGREQIASGKVRP